MKYWRRFLLVLLVETVKWSQSKLKKAGRKESVNKRKKIRSD